MTKKFLFGAAVVLATAGLSTSNVSALCNPPKVTGTFNAITGAFTYFHTNVPDPTSVTARFWSAGGDHTGTCNADAAGFLYFGANTGDIGMYFSFGNGCTVGCPVGSLTLQVTAANATASETLVTTTPETPSGALHFDFSGRGHTMGNNRPRVTTSSRVGNNANLNVTIDPVAAFDGATGDISSINLLSAPGTSDPGRSPAAYTVKTNVPATGAAVPVVFDCSLTPAGSDVWIATQLVSATGGPSGAVSAATRVKCNSALANPNYKVIPKKSMGASTQH